MKLTNKQKTDLAAIVIFKLLEREINAIRAKYPGVSLPMKNCHIETAIAGCINAKTGQWRKTKPSEPGPARELWYSLRHMKRSKAASPRYPYDNYDYLAKIILDNSESIKDFSRQALGN